MKGICNFIVENSRLSVLHKNNNPEAQKLLDRYCKNYNPDWIFIVPFHQCFNQCAVSQKSEQNIAWRNIHVIRRLNIHNDQQKGNFIQCAPRVGSDSKNSLCERKLASWRTSSLTKWIDNEISPRGVTTDGDGRRQTGTGVGWQLFFLCLSSVRSEIANFDRESRARNHACLLKPLASRGRRLEEDIGRCSPATRASGCHCLLHFRRQRSIIK